MQSNHGARLYHVLHPAQQMHVQLIFQVVPGVKALIASCLVAEGAHGQHPALPRLAARDEGAGRRGSGRQAALRRHPFWLAVRAVSMLSPSHTRAAFAVRAAFTSGQGGGPVAAPSLRRGCARAHAPRAAECTGCLITDTGHDH